MSVESLVLQFSAEKLTQFAGRIEACLGKLDDEQIWARGHENENAIGNLVLHLEGNVRQWILGSFTDQMGRRDRDSEFAAREGSRPELLAALRRTVERAAETIRGLDTAQLTRLRKIQNYSVSGVEAVLHVVEHFAQHTGQIIFATKMLTGADMGFYRHLSTRPGVSPENQERLP